MHHTSVCSYHRLIVVATFSRALVHPSTASTRERVHLIKNSNITIFIMASEGSEAAGNRAASFSWSPQQPAPHGRAHIPRSKSLRLSFQYFFCIRRRSKAIPASVPPENQEGEGRPQDSPSTHSIRATATGKDRMKLADPSGPHGRAGNLKVQLQTRIVGCHDPVTRTVRRGPHCVSVT